MVTKGIGVTIDEYCPDNINECSDESCSSGVDESIANGDHHSDGSEECMDVTPSRTVSSTPKRPNGISKKKKSPNTVTPSQILNSSANVRYNIIIILLYALL